MTTPTNADTVVTFSAPIATDDGGGSPTVTADHLSGSLFPIGTTEVHVTATDDVNNASTCVFMVEVVQQTSAGAPPDAGPPPGNGGGNGNTGGDGNGGGGASGGGCRVADGGEPDLALVFALVLALPLVRRTRAQRRGYGARRDELTDRPPRETR